MCDATGGVVHDKAIKKGVTLQPLLSLEWLTSPTKFRECIFS